MRTKSFAGMACSLAAALEQVGDRWTLLLIRDLQIGGPARFEDLRSGTGIPSATLSARLKEMTENGLITRVDEVSADARSRYALTTKGRALWKVTLALREWGDDWDANGLGKPSLSIVHKQSGEAIRLAPINVATGLAVRPDEISIVPGGGADDSTFELLARKAMVEN